MYRVTIQFTNYAAEEDHTTHTITADGVDLVFNTQYNVCVTTINPEGGESPPSKTTFEIRGNGL